MAYVITISDKTVKGNLSVGDVVAIQDIVPSTKEYEMFTVREIKNKTANDLQLEKLAVEPEIKMVWKDGNDYKEIVDMPQMRSKFDGSKFEHNFNKDIANQKILASSAAVDVKP